MGRVTYRPDRVLVKNYKPDPDEDAALEKAVEAVRENLAERNPDRIAYYAISAWILERTLRCSAKGMVVGLGYDLDDTHLRGLAQAALPQIAKSLERAQVDGSVPFYELSKDDIASVVVACFLAMQEATKLNDAVPFDPKDPTKVLDFNSRLTKETAISNAVNAVIDDALVKKRTLQPARNYLGASAVGAACERQVQFEYAGAPRETEFPPKTLRIFDRGHVWEEVVKGWMLDAGFRITQRNQRTGELFGFVQMGGRFKGHVDGVITEGPAIDGMGYPCLWEAKCVGIKSWKEFEKQGAAARPQYLDQISLYQAMVGTAPDFLTANPAILTVVNADSVAMMHIPVPFDAERAQRASDRAVRIIQATEHEELLPRPFPNREAFECKFCPFVERCWSLPA